jgi:hypothetical protein
LRVIDLLRDSGNTLAPSFSILIIILIVNISYSTYGILLLPEFGVGIYLGMYAAVFLWFLYDACVQSHDATTQV